LGQSGGGAISSGPSTFSYIYAHDLGRCVMYLDTSGAANPTTAEYFYTGPYEATGPEHSELITLHHTAEVIFRWSIVTHIEGTGGWIPHSSATGASAKIYGNVIIDDTNHPAWGNGENGVIAADSAATGTHDFLVYNNTFIRCQSGGVDPQSIYGLNIGAWPSSEVRNNYYYITQDNPDATPLTQTHNHYQNSGATHGTNATSGSGNPFVSYTTYNFHLTANTTAGFTLGSPYNVDMFGTTRGCNGTWTRGAIQDTTGC
jgi:hypothetical protein